MATYIKNDTVVDRKEEDGSYFLFEATTGKFRRLNFVGGLIYEMCDGKTEEEQMLDRILEICKNADRVTVSKDVTFFLNTLLGAGLVFRKE